MPTVRLPTPLRALADGAATVEVDGSDVGGVLRRLATVHPALPDRLFDRDGQLHPHVNVFVGERDIRHAQGLATPVQPTDLVSVVPAVAGGAHDDGRPLGVGSWLAHGGQHDGPAVVPGIDMTTTWRRGADNELLADGQTYLREGTALVRRLESVLCRLEGAAATRVLASGMAAIAAVVRSVPAGGRLLVQAGTYWGTSAFVERHCRHAGVELRQVDTTDADAAAAAVATTAPDLVLVEVPSNPWLGITDVAALASVVHAHGGRLAVDATAATPLGLRPLALGADLSLHSATKSLNGHSDLLAGVVSTADATSPVWEHVAAERTGAGAVLGQHEAWLLLRGLRTLHLRHARAVANATAVADHLGGHPRVVQVLHPSLPDHPGHDVHTAQADDHGALLSFRVAGGRAAALRAVGRFELVVRATSLGGTETLVEHRATVQDDVPDDLLRLSVGIEDVDDLLADLAHALGG